MNCKKEVVITNKIYKTIDDINLSLNIYKLDNCHNNDKRAAMIFFFGGGWVGGTIDHFKPQSKHLASKGMVTITADYRVKDKHGTSPHKCVEDGKSAVAWVKNHSQELGIDVNRIALAGGSAGGHVAASTVLLPDQKFINDEVKSIPAAMVLFNPVLDTTKNGYGAEKVGNQPEKLSPVHHIRENLPPTIIFHGTEDDTVPFDNAQEFCKKMIETGNQCTLIPYQGKGHGFFNKDVDENLYNSTLKHTENFLRSLAFIE